MRDRPTPLSQPGCCTEFCATFNTINIASHHNNGEYKTARSPFPRRHCHQSSSPAAMDNRLIWQPIHPSLRPLLDPQYVAFHDSYMQYVMPDDLKVWDGTARTQPSLPPGGTVPAKVGRIQDVQLETCRVRVFVPNDNLGETKYPALLWFHGGEQQ